MIIMYRLHWHLHTYTLTLTANQIVQLDTRCLSYANSMQSKENFSRPLGKKRMEVGEGEGQDVDVHKNKLKSEKFEYKF